MKRLDVLVLLPLLCLVSCNHDKPTTTVELIDMSLSISPSAEGKALDAVRQQIQRMGRGDRLILIPIAGDAENESGGRILRLNAPMDRKAYDADLRAFRKAAARQFATWAAAHGADRSRTDLLGSFHVARQILASSPKSDALRLVVVSDFIDDNGTFNFASAPYLANISRARALATRLRTADGFPLRGVPICLGRLESVDFATLSPKRQKAIDAFWETYLADGSHTPEIVIDGLGMLRSPHPPCLTNRHGDRLEEGRR